MNRTPAGVPVTTDHLMPQSPGAPNRSAAWPILAVAGAGAAVALSAGVYSRLHDPTLQAINTFGFASVLPMKAWFTTVAFALGMVQLYSALRMYERITVPRQAPGWLPTAHRWSGTLAFVASLPVAYHCMWSLGFSDTSLRTVVHGVAGCAFYGVLTSKLLALRSSRMPTYLVPLLGGALVALLTVLWLTSSLWFFTNVGFPT